MLNCLMRRLVAVTFHPFPKSSVHQLSYWLRTPNRISMILGFPNIGNPSFINPSIIRNCPDYAIFAHESRLQTALNHSGYRIKVCRLKIGVTITECRVSSISLKQRKAIEKRILFMFRTSLVCYVLSQLRNVIRSRIRDQATFVIVGAPRR